MTFQSYEDFTSRLLPEIAALPPREQYFFACWCVDFLHVNYAMLVLAHFTPAEKDAVDKALAFMWDRLDDFPDYDRQELYQVFKTIEQIDPDDELDQDNYQTYGIKLLLTSQLQALAFLEEKAPDLALNCAEEALYGIDTYVANRLYHDTTYPFEHPLIRNEVALQLQLLEYLAGEPAVSAADRRIFRNKLD